jgi:phosphonate transport system permease protein
MAEYFVARGLPVPPEVTRTWWSDWRRLLTTAVALAVVIIGLQITDIDLSRSNPEYALRQLGQLMQFDWSVLGPQNEFETWWDGALGQMVITIFLAIVATAFCIVVTLPLSFLGARNIMTGNPITASIYAIARVVFTILRSIDVLILALIGVIVFGIGNAAGVFALAIHNIGVLGKLYSEAIEGIDHGPIEAITATGANRVQVIWASVIPQIVTPFIALTIYRLDTNVRLAPILGLVGGGGIGAALFQYMQLLQYRRAGVIILLIVVTVVVMDFVSAQIRRRLV